MRRASGSGTSRGGRVRAGAPAGAPGFTGIVSPGRHLAASRSGSPTRHALVRVLAVFLALAASVVAAWAGAWNRLAGDGLVITDVTLEGGSRYFDGGGHLLPARSYAKRELDAYVEYGVTDWLTAIVKPSLVSTSLGAPGPASYQGLGTSEAGAQVRLWAFGPAVLAAQGTFRLPATTREDNPALIGNTSRDARAKLLAGVGFMLGQWPSFADLQAGYGIRSGGAPAEALADLTLGTRPVPRLLLLLQDFNTIPEGRGNAWFPRSLYSKLGLTAVYDLSASWSVEIGVFSTVGGVDALQERGVKTGLWYRF